jgi:hypothetical protein
MDLHSKLVSAAVEFDRKQSTKRGYNIYALPQYLQAIESAEECIAKGADVREVLCGHFNDRLLNAMIKAAGLPRATDAECRGNGAWCRRTEY